MKQIKTEIYIYVAFYHFINGCFFARFNGILIYLSSNYLFIHLFFILAASVFHIV